MSQLSHEVNKSPKGATILELNYGGQRILVTPNTFYPVEADFYVIFLPGHRVMTEAVSIIETVEVNVPISFDHAKFLVTDFFCDDDKYYPEIETAVDAAFQEVWPHVPNETR